MVWSCSVLLDPNDLPQCCCSHLYLFSFKCTTLIWRLTLFDSLDRNEQNPHLYLFCFVWLIICRLISEFVVLAIPHNEQIYLLIPSCRYKCSFRAYLVAKDFEHKWQANSLMLACRFRWILSAAFEWHNRPHFSQIILFVLARGFFKCVNSMCDSSDFCK